MFIGPTKTDAEETQEMQPTAVEVQASCFKFYVALGFTTTLNSAPLQGVNFRPSAGYRWHWIGAYGDQTLCRCFILERFWEGLSLILGLTNVGAKFFYDIKIGFSFRDILQLALSICSICRVLVLNWAQA